MRDAAFRIQLTRRAAALYHPRCKEMTGARRGARMRCLHVRPGKARACRVQGGPYVHGTFTLNTRICLNQPRRYRNP